MKYNLGLRTVLEHFVESSFAKSQLILTNSQFTEWPLLEIEIFVFVLINIFRQHNYHGFYIWEFKFRAAHFGIAFAILQRLLMI